MSSVPPGSGPAAIAHGGADSPDADWDGPKRAVDAALAVLAHGGNVLDAAQAGTVILEDDPRFNAGTGARIRLDGTTVQLDASLMSSSGEFGAVAAMEGVKNPILVARAVLDSPHLLVAGDGATRLARQLGHAPYDPATAEVRATCGKIREELLRAAPESEWGLLGIDGSEAGLTPVPTEPGDYPAFYAGVAAAIRDGAPAPVDPRDALEVVRILERAHSLSAAD